MYNDIIVCNQFEYSEWKRFIKMPSGNGKKVIHDVRNKITKCYCIISGMSIHP